MPSALRNTMPPSKLHVAIIMDGNGRWATARAMPRAAGHRAGAEAVRRVVEAAPQLGVGTLTLFAFSADNWKRPAHEVTTLMRLLRAHLASETPKLVANGVRLSIIGRRDRLSPGLRGAVECAEHETARGRTLHLRVAIDYSARDAIVAASMEAVKRAMELPSAQDHHHSNAPMLLSSRNGPPDLSRAEFGQLLAEACGPPSSAAPDVDLVIRTSGEQRLSDFLLWECAYAELYFTSRLWPEFNGDDLARALEEYHARERRFGALPDAAAG